MTQRITIDPITRLEGHGKIEIFLTPEGDVANTYFQIPELRGFERFCVGRPVEEMPTLTNRICGVCPEAHHMAAAKAGDASEDSVIAGLLMVSSGERPTSRIWEPMARGSAVDSAQ